jgi:hypothetical protein
LGPNISNDGYNADRVKLETIWPPGGKEKIKSNIPLGMLYFCAKKV